MNRVYYHLKSHGLYRVISKSARLETTLEPMVVYKNITTGDVWIRPKKEFFDGRFKQINEHSART